MLEMKSTMIPGGNLVMREIVMKNHFVLMMILYRAINTSAIGPYLENARFSPSCACQTIQSHSLETIPPLPVPQYLGKTPLIIPATLPLGTCVSVCHVGQSCYSNIVLITILIVLMV